MNKMGNKQETIITQRHADVATSDAKYILLFSLGK